MVDRGEAANELGFRACFVQSQIDACLESESSGAAIAVDFDIGECQTQRWVGVESVAFQLSENEIRVPFQVVYLDVVDHPGQSGRK